MNSGSGGKMHAIMGLNENILRQPAKTPFYRKNFRIFLEKAY